MYFHLCWKYSLISPQFPTSLCAIKSICISHSVSLSFPFPLYKKGPPKQLAQTPISRYCISIQGLKRRERDRMSSTSCRKGKGCISLRNISYHPTKAEKDMRLQGGNHCAWMRLEIWWKWFHFLSLPGWGRGKRWRWFFYFLSSPRDFEVKKKTFVQLGWQRAWSSCFRCICSINKQFRI